MQLQRAGGVAATLWLVILPCACEDATFLPIHGSLSQEHLVRVVPGDMAQDGNMESLQVHEQRRSQEEPEYTNQAAKGGLAKLTLLISLVAGRLGGALAELTLVLMGLAPLVMASVLCVVNLIGGLIYSKCPRCRPQLEDARQPSAGPGFEYSLLEGCCQSGRVCFWGCCCPSVLWSAMASSPKSRFWGLTFWQMLTLRLSLAAGALIYPALPRFWAGFVSLFGLSFFVMNVLHRQHLRQKFGLVHSTCGSVYDDVWTWFFCQPCATIQEALQVGYTGDPTLGWDDDSARDVPLQMGMVV